MLITLAIAWLHFLGDFPLQSDQMALNKSSSNKWLAIHCLVYTGAFLVVFGWRFALVTFCLHFVTDYFTSRGTSYLWKQNLRHWFFTLIGFDQAIHLTTLILTYHFFVAIK